MNFASRPVARKTKVTVGKSCFGNFTDFIHGLDVARSNSIEFAWMAPREQQKRSGSVAALNGPSIFHHFFTIFPSTKSSMLAK